MLLGDWLERWIDTAVKPVKTLRTYETYRSIIDKHLKPCLGHHAIGALRPDHLEAYYHESTLNPKTLENHHNVLSGALGVAVRHKLIRDNVASLVMNKPRAKDDHEKIRGNVGTSMRREHFWRRRKLRGRNRRRFTGSRLRVE